MDINYTKEANSDFLTQYLANNLSFIGVVTGLIIKNGNEITIKTSRDVTPTERIELDTLINNYSDFDLNVVNCDILEQAKMFSQELMHEFSVRNMQKKHAGEITTVDLYNQVKELTECFVMQALMSGSLEVVIAIIDGVTVDGVVVVPKYVPNHVPQADVDWVRSEILSFLTSL